MRMRKLLVAAAAVAAAGALTLAPAVQANTPTGGNIATVGVGSPPPANGTHPIALTMKSASVNINVFGIPLTINCTAGSAGGVVRSGTLGVPTYEMTMTSMSLTCPSIFPGTTVTMGAICDINVDYVDSNVHNGFGAGDTIDTGTGAKVNRVAGTMNFTNGATNCVLVTISNGCSFRIGGTSTVAFDEALKAANGTQELILSGNTPRIRNVSNCQGAVSDGQGFTLNAVFNVASVNGRIDFRM